MTKEKNIKVFNHSDTFVGDKTHLLVNKSSVMMEKFFINWLEWKQGA